MTICVMAFLFLAFPTLDPVSKEELQIALATLEERFSNRPAMEVVFRTHWEWAPECKDRSRQLLDDSTTTWLYESGKEYFSQVASDDPTSLMAKWVYDGRTTHEWHYDRSAKQLRGVIIWPGAPRSELIMLNPLVWNLGQATHIHNDGLGYYVKAAQRDNLPSGSKRNGLIEIALGSHDVNGGDNNLFLTVDPSHDYRLASWKFDMPRGTYSSRATMEFIVEEFQQVLDESTGARIWFPLHATNKSSMSIARVDVVNVRINHRISNDYFVHQEPPSGTLLREMSTVAGRAPLETLSGGDDAHQQRLETLTEAAKREIDRLEVDGISYDGTPRAEASAIYWWLGGGMLLLGALLCWMLQRKKR